MSLIFDQSLDNIEWKVYPVEVVEGLVITEPSPFRILHKLSPTIATFVVLVAVGSCTVFINVVGTTIWAWQQRFDRP